METIKFYSDAAKTTQVYPAEKTWGNFTLTVNGWSATVDANGYYTQTLTATGMKAEYYPSLVPVYTSSATVEDEKAGFGSLVEIETITNALVAKVLEVPTVALTFTLKGI